MIQLLSYLSPIFYKKGSMIFKENDEASVVIFNMSSYILVGFAINNLPNYGNVLPKGTLIGAYNCVHNKKF
jgi:hypothetical protein